MPNGDEGRASDLIAASLAEIEHRSPYTELVERLRDGDRVALARAFAPRPEILLADEPTGNLDTATGTAIMDLLFGLRDQHGATLILVTHDASLAKRCDRVVGLVDGRLDAASQAQAAE